MNTMSIIILIILIVLSILIISAIAFIGIQVNNELKKTRKLNELVLYADMFKNTNHIYELLDSYINERFNEYKVFNSALFQKEILSNTEQTKIVKELTVDILETMSPAFYSQLSLIFNPSKEKIEKMINNRVVMAVIASTLGLNNTEL